MDHVGVGWVGHAWVGWVMHGCGGSCQEWGGSYRGRVGWVIVE